VRGQAEPDGEERDEKSRFESNCRHVCRGTEVLRAAAAIEERHRVIRSEIDTIANSEIQMSTQPPQEELACIAVRALSTQAKDRSELALEYSDELPPRFDGPSSYNIPCSHHNALLSQKRSRVSSENAYVIILTEL
jgi:hypothetical protein